MLEYGRRILHVSREFDIAHSLVSRFWAAFQTSEKCSRCRLGGLPYSTMAEDDRYIILTAKRNRRSITGQMTSKFSAYTETQIAWKTVARHLQKTRLYDLRPVACVSFTRVHHSTHFKWCIAILASTIWPMFTLHMRSSSVFLLIEDGNLYGVKSVVLIIQKLSRKDSGTCSVMIWVSIMVKGLVTLHVL